MKKPLLVIFIIICCTEIYSQESTKKISGNFGFELSLEQRATLIYNEGIINGSNNSIYYNEHKQLTGTAFNYGFNYHFTRINSDLKFEQSFRYDNIFFETNSSSQVVGVIYSPVNGMITDYHFIFEKGFRLKNDLNLKFGCGYSFMNRGTDFSSYQQIGSFGTEPINGIVPRYFSFSAINFSSGVEKEKIFLTIGGYVADKQQTGQSNKPLILYIKLGYKLGCIFKQ